MANETVGMDRRTDLVVPKVPNFIAVEGSRETIPVADIDDNTLGIIGKAWTKKLIERAHAPVVEEPTDAD